MSTASIIASNYSGEELKALQKSIFPAIILDLPREVLPEEVASQVNQKLSQAAVKEGLVKEQGLPSMPLVCGVGSLQEAQLS